METLPAIMKYYGRLVGLLGKLRFVPYRFNKKSGTMTFDKSLTARIAFGFNLTLFVIYMTTLITNCVIYNLQDGRKTREKMQILERIWIIGSCYGHFTLIRNWGCIAQLWEAMTGLLKRLIADTSAEVKFPKGGIRTMKFVIFFVSVVGGVRTLRNFAKPKNPNTLTSLITLPSSKGKALGIKCICGMMTFYMNAFNMYVYAMIICTNVLFAVLAAVVLQELRNELRPYKRWKRLRERQVRKVYHLHNELAVINTMMNDLFSTWIMISFELVFVVATVVNCFAVVVLGQTMTIVRPILAVILLMTVFNRCAAVHSESQETIASWKRQATLPAWFRKYIDAFERQPLRIRVGSFFYADSSFSLTLLAIIADNAADLILTYRYE